MLEVWIKALIIVGVLTFLIGVVIAYQGVQQLRQFGAETFTVEAVGIGMFRELGVLLTAIIVAGRSGSAFTAQIGTMQVNQEVDAMRTIGLNPIEWLVLPRILALVLSMPLLAFWGDMTRASWAGAVACIVLSRRLVRAVLRAGCATRSADWSLLRRHDQRRRCFGFVSRHRSACF
jgi:phospholipid/cholesterol/gamma-HCH transport system permease protein